MATAEHSIQPTCSKRTISQLALFFFTAQSPALQSLLKDSDVWLVCLVGFKLINPSEKSQLLQDNSLV
ncbi:hypothetical protein CKO50_11985 [Pseudoalteromonas sp. HM-SA03]|nr:hypothetical protein CKO50_11985 [Pseudoalteromonas sp. HM-SA03]